jgi:hypothetical protein
MSILNKGTKVDDIPVKISYRIIELFSAGLYSSPNKAFEELISNSYDAFATKVAVYVPIDKEREDAVMWVCDNGLSMGKQGLKDLWKIGESIKKGDSRNTEERLIIGRFGIGKLATYILTHDLTYICKSKEGYYAVEMDYSQIKKDQETDSLTLDEIQLTEDQTKELLNPYLKDGEKPLLPFNLWGADAESTWTFCIMSKLKPKANQIQEGRLKWILKTALPLNPNFQLHYDGDPVESTKLSLDPIKTWVIGDNDSVVEKNPELYTAGTYKGQPSVDLPSLKNVTGKIDFYADSLVRNDKSEKWGRSHGIFLMVRKRLINLDDALMGMPAMTHGVFNRLRIEVYADGLDEYLASTRENIQDVLAYQELKEYITKKFTEAREYYFQWLDDIEKKSKAVYKITHTASSLSRRPLLVAAKKFFANEITSLTLTEFPRNLTKDEKKVFIEQLEKDLTSDEGIIKDVKWVPLNPEDPMARLDLKTGIASINLMHPFFANFVEDVRNPLPFQLIALTEILTEVSLIEQGIAEDDVKEIINRRDRILRELTFSDKANAPAVAGLIRATLSDPDGLEDSLTKAFSTLGFETTPIGGSGKPDGVAFAPLGFRGSSDNYSFTYDAKSTSKERIMASTAHISGVNRHRIDYNANYAVVVAINFQGAEELDSAVNKEAKHLRVNLIRAADLMTLVLLAGPKFLGLSKLRDLFENCHTVIETSKWIEDLRNSRIERGPIKEILEAAFELIKNDIERPKISAIRQVLINKHSHLKDITSARITQIAQGIETIVPNYISVSTDEISLQNTPEIILKAINQISAGGDIPYEYRNMFMDAFKLNA